MNPIKTTEMNGISPRLLKDYADQLAPVTALLNLSILHNKISDDLKHGKVTPLFKRNDKLDVSNYRLISVLSCISKVLENLHLIRCKNTLPKSILSISFNQASDQGTLKRHACYNKLILSNVMFLMAIM